MFPSTVYFPATFSFATLAFPAMFSNFLGHGSTATSTTNESTYLGAFK